VFAAEIVGHQCPYRTRPVRAGRVVAAIVGFAAQLFKIGIAFSASFLLILSRQLRPIVEICGSRRAMVVAVVRRSQHRFRRIFSACHGLSSAIVRRVSTFPGSG
jgi:hypothetical protein